MLSGSVVRFVVVGGVVVLVVGVVSIGVVVVVSSRLSVVGSDCVLIFMKFLLFLVVEL